MILIGDPEKIYSWIISELKKDPSFKEEIISDIIQDLKEDIKNSKIDYTDSSVTLAMLEKDVYRLYANILVNLIKEINGKVIETKQELEAYFQDLETKEQNSSISPKEEAALQFLRNSEAVEPILQEEQAKREALKKLEANKKL